MSKSQPRQLATGNTYLILAVISYNLSAKAVTNIAEELAYMTFQWSESKKHCTRTKMCELELVGPITTSNYLTVAPGMTISPDVLPYPF